ncbi:MAG: hypothetical protein JSR73_12165 [Proteobacteria bacterium]|nr:hypothetical protein [Pseudomonadota bacterium]
MSNVATSLALRRGQRMLDERLDEIARLIRSIRHSSDPPEVRAARLADAELDRLAVLSTKDVMAEGGLRLE